MLKFIKLRLVPFGVAVRVAVRERKPGVTILGYHRVGGNSADQFDLPAELFEWQMHYLRRRLVVGLDEVEALARRGQSYPYDVIAVTFDDGYEDVYRHAFPILQRYQVPATLYLTTSYLETGSFPQSKRSLQARQTPPLAWAQVKEMVASGLITVGAHTHTHPDMGRLPEPEIEREITESNRLIARRLDFVPVHFSYPWGRASDLTRKVIARVYRTAVIGGSRKNPYGRIDLHSLYRMPIKRSDSRLLFRLKLGSTPSGEEGLGGHGNPLRRT